MHVLPIGVEVLARSHMAASAVEGWRFAMNETAVIKHKIGPEFIFLQFSICLSWCEQTRTDSVVSKPGQSVIGLACSGG